MDKGTKNNGNNLRQHLSTGKTTIDGDEFIKEQKEKLHLKEEKRKTKAEAKYEKRKNKLTEKINNKQQNNNHKLAKMQLKEVLKKEQDQISNKHLHLRWYNFFTKWFFIGLFLVFAGLCISLLAQNVIELLKPCLDVLAGLFSSVGVALFVGCIFDFSKNSEEFVAFISKLLSDIIVSKTFLSSLGAADKREAMKLILQPSNRQVEQYSNINEFFKKKIEDNMKMFDTNFKTNLIINVEAKRDSNNVVYCESSLSYHVYKVREEFEPIKLVLEKHKSEVPEVIIISDEGETIIDKKNIKIESENTGGIEQTVCTFNIPEKLQKKDHLMMKYKVYEPGHDHWINYCWTSLTPHEGVMCHVKCFDDLIIKDYMIFDNKSYYHVDIAKDRGNIEITSSQWLESDVGFFITIAEKDKKEGYIKE